MNNFFYFKEEYKRKKLRGDILRKNLNMVIVILVTFMTLVAIFSFKTKKVNTAVYDEYNNIQEDVGYIFDDYYNVNINFK